jgi:hypothetical protein
MKVIRITESDLTNIVKKVIKESAVKDSLIDMIKYDGWESAAELVGGVENLKKMVGIETPMDFLNIFTDLDVVQSKEEPYLTLYRYEEGNNMIGHNRKNDDVYINYRNIWSFLQYAFGFKYSKIQEIIEEWLFEVYNLRYIKLSPLFYFT